MYEGQRSEYDVVRLRLDRLSVSLACAAYAFVVGVVIDDLPFVMPRKLWPWLTPLIFSALVAALAGAVLAFLERRRPGRRGLAQFSAALNAVIFVLVGLFVVLFRLILGRGP